MRGGWSRRRGRVRVLLGWGLVLGVLESGSARADDTSLLGRLFRFGGESSSNRPPAGGRPAPLPYGRAPRAGGGLEPSATPLPADPGALPTFGGLPETPPLPEPAGPAQRLTPRPRVSPAITSADPVLTRFALGRSTDGSPFGMFLQVFADGTVVDSDGVHRLRLAEVKPLLDTIQSGELDRLRGHCGAPSTDFVESMQIVTYQRRFGRLTANSFSYSG